MRIVTPKEMAQLDQYTIGQGTSAQELMEKAGIESFKIIKEYLKKKDKILVICGSGNNGGDGQVIARLLKEDGYKVEVLFTTNEENLNKKMSPESKRNYELLKNYNIPIVYGESIDNAIITVEKADIIIDCIFGTGLDNRPLNEYYTKLITAINNSKSFIFAIDIPSGLSGYSGTYNQAVKADITIAIECLKTGEILENGPDVTGTVYIVDIGINKKIKVDDVPVKKTIKESKLKFPFKRLKNTYKYNYGRVLILAGSKGMLGAASLAARGALFAGAGLVTNLIPYNLYDALVSISPLEALVKPFDVKPNFQNLENIQYDTLLIGPGLGTNSNYTDLMVSLLESDNKLVIDADGLKYFKEALTKIDRINAEVVITPHQGEFAALLDKSVQEIKENSLEFVTDFAKKNRITVVLKGYRTLVISKKGKVWFNTTGNPGMATPGSGDVLSGMLASIFAQLKSPIAAAKAAVYYHGLAGDSYTTKYGETTLTASKILDELKFVF